MKNKYTAFVFAIIFFGSVTIVQATVGGPTYVYNLKYNPADSSLYYIELAESGRGCPPVLKKISVITLQTLTVLSCNDGEKIGNDGVETEINGITTDFKYISQIDLNTNKIRVDLAFSREEKIEEWVTRTLFTARIYQNDTFITEFPVTGCSLDQPFVIGGYEIPGLNKKLVLLVSTKSDCMEGGYTGETLHPINADVLDRTSVSNSYKFRSALAPTESTLVVYEQSRTSGTPVISSSPTPSPIVNEPVKSDAGNNQITTALIAAAFLIIGVALGYHTKR